MNLVCHIEILYKVGNKGPLSYRQSVDILFSHEKSLRVPVNSRRTGTLTSPPYLKPN